MTIDDWNDTIESEIDDMYAEGISSFKMYMTYPAMMPIAEIDHIVHDKGVNVGDMETKYIAGSDHRALLATLEVA